MDLHAKKLLRDSKLQDIQGAGTGTDGRGQQVAPRIREAHIEDSKELDRAVQNALQATLSPHAWRGAERRP